MEAVLNKDVARKVLETVDAGLVEGLGEPIPGRMCVEAAVNYALGHEHGDRPSCVGDAVRAFKIRLNDAAWPTNEDRTKGMRKLAIAQLGSNTIDQNAFREYVVIETVKRIVPIALRAAASMIPKHKEALEAAASACEVVVDFASARATARAARETAYTARAYAYAAYADAYAAAYADAADAADADAYAAAAAADAYADAYAAAADADAAAYADAAAAYADAAAAAAAAAADADADAAAYADAAYAAAAYAAAAYADAAAADAAAYADAAAAYAAAAYADAAAADAAAYADAAYADAAAAYAAAVKAKARIKVLSLAAEIGLEALKKLKSPGCEWLDLCE